MGAALYWRRRTRARNGPPKGSPIVTGTIGSLRRGLLLVSLVLLGTAVGACGGDGITPTPASAGDDGTLVVVNRSYAFEPRSFVFEAGETVEFHLSSTDGPHTFTVRDLGISWVVAKEDEPQVQTFTFERAGTFKLICAIPGHQGSGMVGTMEVR